MSNIKKIKDINGEIHDIEDTVAREAASPNTIKTVVSDFIKDGTIQAYDDAEVKQEIGDIKETITNIIYDVTKYGISVDNTNNSEKLQALINIVSRNGGGTIYFPNGTYKFDMMDSNKKCCVTVLSNVSIIGENQQRTILKCIYNPIAYSLFYRLTATDAPIENAKYKNFTVDQTECTVWDTCAKAFYMQSLKNCTFEDLTLIGTPATALGVDYLYQCVINKVTCIDCGKMYVNGRNGSSGIGIGAGGYEDENLIITNCICVGSGQFGIFVEQQKPHGWGGNFDTTKGVVISNNIVRGGLKHGIGVRGSSNVVISNNSIYDNSESGIFVDGGFNINITGNVIKDNKKGISLSCDSTDIDTIMMTNNLIVSNKEEGISVENSSDTLKINNMFILGNSTLKNTVCGLAIGNVVIDNYSIRGNTFMDCVTNMAQQGVGKVYSDLIVEDFVTITSTYDAECPYKLCEESAITKYKMILNLSGSMYLYVSEAPFYIKNGTTEGDYREAMKIPSYRYETNVTQCSTSPQIMSDRIIGILNDDYFYNNNATNLRNESVYVWANHNLLDWDTKEVVITAGLHE